ncbi:hypothetical protein T01_10086 [Trichinella spiralis]|uniref:Uncharacterized protein n=1 Tax=Trichinella spiralis TaxID=6334 RepID=A0A0V1BZF4_TRISP|nr:hypothetical protein T01_10086 [Trichinella spiralis]
MNNVTAVFSLSRMRKKIQLKCHTIQLKAACSIFAHQWPKLAGNIFCPKIKNKCEGGDETIIKSTSVCDAVVKCHVGRVTCRANRQTRLNAPLGATTAAAATAPATRVVNA